MDAGGGVGGPKHSAFLSCLRESREDSGASLCLAGDRGNIADHELTSGIEASMLRGFFQTAGQIVTLAKARNLDILNIVGNTAARIRSDLQVLTDSVVHKTEGIIPAYE